MDGDHRGTAYRRGVSSHHFSSTYTQTTSLFVQARNAQLCVCRRSCRHYTQSTAFVPIEETLTSTLDGLSEYYTTIHLRANPTKTQVSLFNLRNREYGKQINISWNGVNLTHCNPWCILASHWTERVIYKAHIEKTKKKVGTRNNIIRKLRNLKWGATPTTLRSSALALCYSAA